MTKVVVCLLKMTKDDVVSGDEDQDDSRYAAIVYCKDSCSVKHEEEKKYKMRTFHIPDIPKVDMRSPANNAPDCSLLESSSVQDSQIKMLKSDPLPDHPDESGHDADGCRCQSWRSKLCDCVDHRNLMMIRVRIITADYNRYC